MIFVVVELLGFFSVCLFVWLAVFLFCFFLCCEIFRFFVVLGGGLWLYFYVCFILIFNKTEGCNRKRIFM